MAGKRQRRQRRKRVDWRNPSDLVQLAMLAATTAAGVVLGTLTRILDQVREGKRERFWSRMLLVDGLGVLFVILIALGVAEYFRLGQLATVALSVVLGRAGPPLIDHAVENVFRRGPRP